MSVQVKICGLTDEAAVRAATSARASYIGFIHFPASPRHLALPDAAKLKALLPAGVQSVSVLVDPDDALLGQVQMTLKPDFVQMHGKETPDRLRAIRRHFPKLKIIKAISVSSGDDVAQAMRYGDVADMLMFDAKPPKDMLPGGNGLAFDWALLKGREFPKPWFLSGGLTPENVAEAIHATGAHIVDVSSGVESAPGVKDVHLIEAFVKAARQS